jgi:hypothetical protein
MAEEHGRPQLGEILNGETAREPRFNALRHGLTARTIMLGDEEAEQFESLRDDLFRQWRPLGESECGAVYEMAEAQWRLMRCSPMEAELLESLRDPDAPVGGLAAAFLGGREADGGALLRLMRYRTTIERSYDRALHNLLLLHRVRGVWSKPNLAEPEEGEEDPLESVNPRWCGRVAGAEPMARREDDDDNVTVTVERVIIGEDGEEIPREEYLANKQEGEESEAQSDSNARPDARERPKPDILRNGTPQVDENSDRPGFSDPLSRAPRDRRRS